MAKIAIEDMHFVPKAWGFERWICNSDKYCGKLLHINSGHFSSWHKHNIKDEHMVVQSGILEILYGDDDDIDKATSVLVHPGQAFHIPVGLRHRLKATYGDVEFLEVSTTHYDSDSIRVIPGQ
jgi:mannose-6-phosphate isomerase-like protein (cupin superfamily)